MKILAIRIGDKYGPEYETYLERKLPNHEFIWVREPYDTGVVLQWNKMWGMQMDIDEPICVIDIDILFYNDEIIETIDLCIPHKYLSKRKFVLLPLYEIAEELNHPKLNKTIAKLLDECIDVEKVDIYEA